jgi:hypothetical protein
MLSFLVLAYGSIVCLPPFYVYVFNCILYLRDKRGIVEEIDRNVPVEQQRVKTNVAKYLETLLLECHCQVQQNLITR